MVELKKGMLARSKAGHDSGEVFVINQVEQEYVYLVDGCSRTLDHPKKKKRKHIQVIYCTPVSYTHLDVYKRQRYGWSQTW